ncbi:addiction module antidote protein, HigA family [Actinomyces sp. 2119]|uniref:HigA family addiction module antitoxin n=1 Tax=Actinomyces sp. 2119 TaxID=2321393 RepID=UPI000E6C7C87|nr:HigA family addiction module antitoxin [Actinomyces sp. 2119]RJF40365.1 addiction module antidote protein, HigA family [Actinomyces sp. 2119]
MTQRPNYVVPTGDFVEEWMEDQGVSAAELSRRLGVSRRHVSRLLHGEVPLSREMALRLEEVTGVPARIWNLHETGYRERWLAARPGGHPEGR